MAEGVKITDVSVLEELKSTLQSTKQNLTETEKQVSNHLSTIQSNLGKQLDQLQKKVNEAQDELTKAETALDKCEASQHEDEDGNITPSCSLESFKVQQAKAKLSEAESKRDKGIEIMKECNDEISNYKENSQKMIQDMCGNDIPKTCTDLDEYTANVNEILEQDVGGDGGTNCAGTTPTKNSNGNDVKIFNKGIENVKKKDAENTTKKIIFSSGSGDPNEHERAYNISNEEKNSNNNSVQIAFMNLRNGRSK